MATESWGPPDGTTGAAGESLRAELYSLVSAGAPFGFAVRDARGQLLDFNRPLVELFGIPPEEVRAIRGMGVSVAAFEALAAALAQRLADPEQLRPTPIDSEATSGEELVLRDGSVVELQVGPARDGAGRTVGRIAFFRDVTRRQLAEQDIRDRARQQASLAALAELAMNAEDLEPLLHAACGTAVDVLEVDAAAFVDPVEGGLELELRAVAGLPPETVGRRVSTNGRSEAELALGRVVSGTAGDPARPLLACEGFVASIEVGLPGRDRIGVFAVLSRTPRVFSGEDLRFVEMTAGVLASALARRRAETEVMDRERQMRAVFDSALDAMLIVDDAGVIRDANPAAAVLLGAPRATVPGTSLLELAPAARAKLAGLVGSPDSARLTGETDVALPGHKPKAVEFAAIPRILPGRHLAVMRDITERKQLHTRLALADRMVSVGTLAAGVAHELNNPLAYVNANLSFLAERLGEVTGHLARVKDLDPADADLGQQLEDAVKDARDGAERMRVIIRDLKTFSRAEEEKTGPVDVRQVLESCVNMAWNEIRHRARLVKDFGAIPSVRGNEARLGQVFLNLVVNAAQAIPEGRADANEIRIVTKAMDGGRVAVEVRDTGCGIPAENLPRIFDPFFTTKAPGVGTGLGLSICHSIVAAMGGEIQVESQVPGGTTFRVVLPASGAGPAIRAPEPTPRPARPRGRLLVVDDEPLVGTVIQRALQAEHDIVVASSARAALAKIEAGERFDLVLSDLLMPEMSGMELYHALRERQPALARRMIFLTGGAFTPAARDFLEQEQVVCIEKPFELETIRAVLAKRLAETR